jgi:hypothetical protein
MDLAHVLYGMFDTGFDDLPEDVRQEVARRFHPFHWDDLTPGQRRTLAAAAGGEVPRREDEFRRHWKLYAERAELLRQASEWWQVATPTAADKATQEDRVAALRRRIKEIDDVIAGIVPTSGAAPATAPTEARAGKVLAWQRERSDAITFDIEAAVAELGAKASPSQVMAYLKGLVGKPGASIIEVAPDGVIWARDSGTHDKLTQRALADRLYRVRKYTRQSRANALKPR